MKKTTNFNFVRLLVLALFLMCGNSSMARSAIKFSTDEEGHIFIKAEVNGVAGNFLFDTGAGITLVTRKYAAKVKGLKLADQNFTAFRATGEPVSVNLSSGANLTIGDFADPAPVISVIDADLGPADGLISLSSFKNQVFTIDYEHKQLIFENRSAVASIKHKAYIIPLQPEIMRDKSYEIFAYFIVNKKLVLQFSMDSGAGDGVFRINARYAQQLNIDTAAARKATHKSEFNPNIITHNYFAEIKSIAAKNAPDISRNTTRVTLIEGMIYDGIMSLSWIGKRVTFDLKDSELIVQKQ
jgi:hypothetical protein